MFVFRQEAMATIPPPPQKKLKCILIAVPPKVRGDDFSGFLGI